MSSVPDQVTQDPILGAKIMEDNTSSCIFLVFEIQTDVPNKHIYKNS